MIKSLRKWRGLTQVQMAERTGQSQSYLSEIEAEGGKKGSPEVLAKIAEALDVPVDWLA